MNFTEAWIETGGPRTIYLVVDEDGVEWSFKSAAAANAEFPGAFDVPIDD